MPDELARDLYHQARDRVEEFETGRPTTSPATPTPGNDGDEDRLAPPAGAQVHEAARLRRAAEMAESAHRLAREDDPDRSPDSDPGSESNPDPRT